MSKILALTKFRGDNQASLQQWILQFEAQITALVIEEYRWKQMLLCCTKGSAFTTFSTASVANENLTHGEINSYSKQRVFKSRVTTR